MIVPSRRYPTLPPPKSMPGGGSPQVSPSSVEKASRLGSTSAMACCERLKRMKRQSSASSMTLGKLRMTSVSSCQVSMRSTLRVAVRWPSV